MKDIIKKWVFFLLKNPIRIKYFWIWFLYFTKNPLQAEKPWMSIEAVDYLEKILNKKMVGFEWGSGGSTLFFSNKTKKLYSVEHDKSWFLNVKRKLGNNYKNVNYFLIEPQEKPKTYNFDKINNYRDNKPPFNESFFKKYVKKIDIYPDNYFDYISIDGRARPSCIINAIPKLKKGGYLILDNSERLAYNKAINILNEWERKDFYGPLFYENSFTQTSVFKKM